MLMSRPRRRMASRVPSTNSLRRSTLCRCQRRLRPSTFTVVAVVRSATVENVRSLAPVDITARGLLAADRCICLDDGEVAHRLTDPARPKADLGGTFAADASADEQRRKALRRMKLVALGFLVGATVLFLACRWAAAHEAGAWAGYVGAAAEAGMVGALADWFAVTALFKHPLGIPIPHTAIIKRKKDQLGEGLGTFVRENFLSADVVEEKLRDAQVASRLGKWMADRGHATRVAGEASNMLRVLIEMLRDDDVQHVFDRMIIKRL